MRNALVFTSALMMLPAMIFAQSLDSYRSEAEVRAHSVLEGAKLDGRAELYKDSRAGQAPKKQMTETARVRDNTAKKVEHVLTHETAGHHQSLRPETTNHGKRAEIRGRSH